MRNHYLLTILLFLFFQLSIAQVGIGTTIPDTSSELDVSSPLNNKGILIPRMTQAQRNLIATPATSLLIYQTDNTPGFYYYNGSIWVGIQAGTVNDWSITGNSGTTPTTNFIGTTDDNDIVIKRNNIRAGFIGNPNTASGNRNTSLGANTLLTPSATGIRNVAIGTNVLPSNNNGNLNVAIGESSMFTNTNGTNNTAVGAGSLYSSQLGVANTAIGRNALTTLNGISGSQGSNNTAVGYEAIRQSTTGQQNTALGREALRNNLIGDGNVAVGYQSGKDNTGSNNITIGKSSEVPVLANSNQLSIGNVVYGTTMTSTAAGKIGIGESNPNAKLQITSSSQASPAITDGIIIPKVDNLTALPTAAQEGMLVYLNAISGTNQPGFYYWDNDIPSWVGLNSTVNGDHDWYKVGTTTAPTTITDDMFHLGNVAIGKNTANHSLDIETTSTDNSINILNSNNSNNIISGNRIVVNGSGTNTHFGNFNTLSGAGTGTQTGVFNVITNSSDSDHIGIENQLLSNGNGKHTGSRNELGGTGTGTHIGIENLLNGSASTSKTGFRNLLNDTSAGTMTNYAIQNTITSSSSGDKIGIINNINADNSGIRTGIENNLSSTNATEINGIKSSLFGNLDMYGSKINLTNNGTDNTRIITGSLVNISGTTTSAVKGTDTQISTSGNSAMYGNYTSITSTAVGTGAKYGSYNLISTTAGGDHYGVYSNVLKAGATNFAGYFLGNVGIGTTNLNTYTLPASRAASAGQIMQSNGTGIVTWQTPAAALNSYAWLTTGNSGINATTNFIGTTDSNALVFRSNNIERMRINPADGEIVTGALASPYPGDNFNGVATATLPFAVNGYTAQNGSGVWGETLAAGTSNFSSVQGVYGGTGVGSGVFGNYAGTNASNTRAGVQGIINSTSTATGGAAVLGNNQASSGNQHMGVLGLYNGSAYGIGVYGIGFGGGLITGNNDVAVVGWKANNTNYSGYFNGNHVIANGTKSASVGTSKGNQLLYVTETPEVWFEDIGGGQLLNGSVHISLDDMYLETIFVDQTHPMRIFLQEEGESNGLIVIKDADNKGFTVKEKNGGTSNISFSYRIMAKRLHFQDHRFGNDPVWGAGDTRKYNQYAPPPPVDYEENKRFQEKLKKDYKPTPMPEGFVDYITIQKQLNEVETKKTSNK